MQRNLSARQGAELLLALPVRLCAEEVPLLGAWGRVLATDVTARINVPPFPRSPYDGYALRAADTLGASEENPVTLALTEELPAGTAPRLPLEPGQAAKILTGAPIPPGADCVVKYEDTRFTDSAVTLFSPLCPGNIVPAGEDVAAGSLLAQAGAVLDPGLTGVLAGQGLDRATVFRRPSAAVVSTGSELAPQGSPLAPGQIYGTNLYTIGGLLAGMGCTVRDGGTLADDPDALARTLAELTGRYDLVVTTGGASVGDYDYTQRAIEAAGGEVLFHKLAFKPGGAMLAGVLNGTVVLGLSGSPGAAAVGLLAVARPYVLKLCGRPGALPAPAILPLKTPLKKASPQTRYLRGRLVLEEGRALFEENPGRGNGSAFSLIHCELLAEIPALSPPLAAGTPVTVYRVTP